MKVLFVCLGNICRSPTAEGVFKKLIQERGKTKEIQCDSAGTSAYHQGELPDPRSREMALSRGVDISDQRSRQVRDEDFYEYDFILAMDGRNFQDLKDIKPSNATAKIAMLLEYHPSREDKNVPDPYWSGADGFALVYDLIEEAIEVFIQKELNI